MITVLGVLSVLLMLAEGAYLAFVTGSLVSGWLTGVVTSLPFALGISYVGWWLPDSFISPSRYRRIWLWCVGGLGVFVVVNVALLFALPPESGIIVVSWLRWAAVIGAGIGLVIGVFEARSIERAVEAERTRIRASEAEDRENLLAYLNAMLRHEVLNTVAVIVGYTDLAEAEHDGDGTVPHHLATIRSNAEEMESVIKDVRLLLEASQTGTEPEPVDVTALLTAEIDGLRAVHGQVSVDASLPEQAMVWGAKPLRRAFSNLLQNAVEHNDSDTPRVEVTVEQDSDTVSVEIADNGPGLPESERDELFDRELRHDSNHGLGLVLTHLLVENYGGTLEVTETGPEGTVFTLTFRRASEPFPDRPDADGGATVSPTAR